MVNKSFYQLAANEVAQGRIDQALWVKVVADSPSSGRLTQQSKYIQLRAQELSIQSASVKAVSLWSKLRRLLIWVLAAVVAGYVIFIVALVTITYFDYNNLRKNVIKRGEVVRAHISSKAPDTFEYENSLIGIRQACRSWQIQRADSLVGGWAKGTPEQDDQASAVCTQVAGELKRLEQSQSSP